MSAYIIRRLLLLIPTVFLVGLIIFVLVQLVPGDVVDMLFSQMTYHFKERDLEAIKEAMGIGVPSYIQFGRWIGGLFHGDLGNSLWSGRPVVDEIIPRLSVSAELSLMALLVGLIISIPIGIYAAMRQDTWGDYIGRTFATVLLCLPTFWVGIMVMVYPSVWWDWTPPVQYIPFAKNPAGNLLQFLIPAVILGMYLAGTTMRMTRSMMLEVLRQDYIRTAWSKGLKERTVVMRHALKNALIPVLTLIGIMTPFLIGGTVVVEQIFSLPGVGRLLMQAIGHRDYVVLAGVNVFIAGFILIVNLIVDLSYAYLDPKIRYR